MAASSCYRRYNPRDVRLSKRSLWWENFCRSTGRPTVASPLLSGNAGLTTRPFWVGWDERDASGTVA
ncbi:hypothetical protein [uncultured Sphaerochaeta sp.]|uniref:hypothetical protein n=1 Tax=uncultured Sphaerochaeta sp. TaxID=886478 RepID=UPI002A0A93BF|nr:hypothetical protein [uncultured Sphaerochaeta sp.]